MPISRLRKPIGGTMAIQDSFNLSQATTSQAYAYKCWYNYNYGGNTMKISAKDMGELTQTWNGELANWRATASNDENAYEIEDDDFSTAKNNGKNAVKNDTGYDGGKGGMITRGVVDGVAAGVGAASSLGVNILGKAITGKAANAMGSVFGEKAAQNAVNKLGDGGLAQKEQGATFIVAAPLALATGTAYVAKKPNKEQKEACDELQNSMQNAQASLYSAQEDMSEYGDAIVDLSDQAQAYNEDANSDIEDKKTEFDMYKASYDALMEKAKSGEPLSEDEKALLKELIPLMQELGIGIGETSDETTEAVGEIYDEMGTYQEGYDNAASTMAEVEGVTDYAESFDDATRTMCYVEAGAQTLNAASGAKAALQAGKFASSGGLFTSWAWAFAAMGAAGAAMSGVGATQQFQWAGEVGNEINARKDTQDLNATTTGIYDENIDIYAGQMEGVEGLELEIPEDMENPDDVVAGLSEESEGVLAQNYTPGDSKLDPANNCGVVVGGTTTGGETGTTPNDKDKDKEV